MRNFVTIAACMFLGFAIAAAADDNKDPKKVELTGTLRTGVVAIGGETTGIIMETKKGKFELTFGKQKELRDKAENLNGKAVTAIGTLEIRKGVEVKERKIVTVISLEEAKAK